MRLEAGRSSDDASPLTWLARAAGWSVTAACSYAAAYMAKHPQDSAEQRHVDDLLDEALDESFPASDSPSVGGSS